MCIFSFGVSWVVGAVLIFVLSLVQLVVLSRISIPLMLLYFSIPNHRLSAFARNSKLTLLRHRHCCPFVVVSRLSAPTQRAIRSRVFCRCFADKVGFVHAAPAFELCSSTRHFAFVRPMFSDLSLLISQSRRNAQLNWLTFVWTLLVVDVATQLVYLFSVCYFVLALPSS